MPGIPLVYLTEADHPEEQEGPHPILNLTALKVKLLLPSDLDPSIRQQYCPSNIVQTEIRLRFAVAEDTLRDLRKYLTAKKTLVNYKIKHVSGPGQRANTRARAIIDCFSQGLIFLQRSIGLPGMPWPCLIKMAPRLCSSSTLTGLTASRSLKLKILSF